MSNKTLIAIVILLIGLALFFIVQKNTKDTENGASTLSELRVGYIPIADASQLYVANDLDIFSKHGLEVKPIAFSGGAKIIQALAAGELDIGFTGTVPLVQANAQGLKIQAITGGAVQSTVNAYQALVVAENSDITTPKQLEGKTIGINAFRSIDHAFTLMWLEKNGVNIDTIKFVEIPFPQMEAVLSSGQIQASSLIEPFITLAKNRQAIRVLDYHIVDVKPEFEMTTYAVDADKIEGNQEKFAAFQLAISEATSLINQGELNMAAIISKNTGLDEQTTSEMVFPSFSNQLTIDNLKFVSDMLVQLGFIETSPDLDSLLADDLN